MYVRGGARRSRCKRVRSRAARGRAGLAGGDSLLRWVEQPVGVSSLIRIRHCRRRRDNNNTYGCLVNRRLVSACPQFLWVNSLKVCGLIICRNTLVHQLFYLSHLSREHRNKMHNSKSLDVTQELHLWVGTTQKFKEIYQLSGSPLPRFMQT